MKAPCDRCTARIFTEAELEDERDWLRTNVEHLRAHIEDAMKALEADMPGEAWMALYNAMKVQVV